MGARTRGLANNVLTSGKLDATDALSGTISASNIANASLTSATSFGSVTGGVPAVASDPPSPSEGDIWYNTTSGQIKFRTQAGAWTSGGNQNTGRAQGAGDGTQTAAFVAGGATPPTSPNRSTLHEQYDGTSWTEVNDLGTACYACVGFGTTSAALLMNGYTGSYTGGGVQSWDGSSWSGGTSVNSGRGYSTGAGTQTAGLISGGYVSGPVGNVESWNGTSWTETTDLNTSRRSSGMVGISTASLYAGGTTDPSPFAGTETWNGSTWTEVGDLNTGGGITIFGTSTSAVGSGRSFVPGYPVSILTESWDGSSWTEVADMTTIRENITDMGAGASSSVGLIPGGRNPSPVTATEEWNFGPTTTVVG